jgi:DNA helicase-2/ATP-dependent DNA helicase PcrA
LIEYFRQTSKEQISDILQEVLEKSGLLDLIKQDGDEERINNIEELMQSIKSYEQTLANEEDINLLQYLQDIALYTNFDYKNDSQFLKLMTIHQAKGLEFDIVFIVGMTEGTFPNHRSIRERGLKALEEERRLVYVAITRAGKELYFSESEGYSYETFEKYPSRFIYEIKENLIESKGVVPSDLRNGLESIINNLNGFIEKEDIVEFKEDDIVIHPVFGEGKVLAVGNDQYHIYFFELKKSKPILKSFYALKRKVEDNGK